MLEHVAKRREDIKKAIGGSFMSSGGDDVTKSGMKKTMDEWKEGTLHSGSGAKVTDQKQAIAIGLSEEKKMKKAEDETAPGLLAKSGDAVEAISKKELVDKGDQMLELSETAIQKSQREVRERITGSYNGTLQKGKGEGSRGGKIIGHTSSGKAIYANASHASHKAFTSQDHAEASKYHAKMAVKHAVAHHEAEPGSSARAEHLKMTTHHTEQEEAHHYAGIEAQKKEHASLANESKGMKHLQHEDGLSHGGFSAKLWNSPHIQNYTEGYGAIYHENRTPERDAHLESQLHANGLDADQAAAFLISKQGRHTMDAYSEGNKRVEKDLPSNIAWHKKENTPGLRDVLAHPEGKKIIEGIEGLDLKRKDHKPLYEDYKNQLKSKFNYDYEAK